MGFAGDGLSGSGPSGYVASFAGPESQRPSRWGGSTGRLRTALVSAVVSYCTVDVHIGAGELPVWNVAFNGRANAAAALEYAYEWVAELETVLATGCCAGSLGAVVWSRWVAAHYAMNARHIQFGDSYVGVTCQVRAALDRPRGSLPPLPPLPPPASVSGQSSGSM